MTAQTAIFKQTIRNLMLRYGAVGSVTINVVGVYDDATQTVTETATDYAVRVMPLDYMLKRNGEQRELDSLIEAGDKQVFIEPISADSPLPKVEPNRDTVTLGGEVFRIISLKELNTDLQGPILLEAYLRR